MGARLTWRHRDSAVSVRRWFSLTALPIETDVEGKGPRMTTSAAGNGNFTPQDSDRVRDALHDGR